VLVEPDTQIDGWRVEAELGRGDFATVYRVRSLNETVAAMKLCSNGNAAALERLRFEQRALETFDHRRIPRLLGQGETQTGQPFLVMSLMPGRSIREHLQNHQADGRLYGDLQAARLARQLLDALAHIHDLGFVHRDIKDANVLHALGPDSIGLIDFGFCKEAGMSALRVDDSFFRAGSARFSPPSKLANPASANPAHDVFAIGVLVYRMVTGRYPWSVARTDDVAAFRAAHEEQPLVPAIELNSYLLPQLSDWITQLLELDDHRRPSAEQALDQIEPIVELDSAAADRSRWVSRPSYPYVLRDPLHGDIRLTDEEYRVLETPEMQRLRDIKQLGLTNFVYPGAEHSRLSHSLGSVARVEQILRYIEERDGIRIDADLRTAARLYALTHDVLHIPFGHTLEDELSFFPRHDANEARRERLVDRPESALGLILRSTDVGRLVMSYLATEPSSRQAMPTFVDLVSGVTGADVLDYIDRDAYFCGLEHRIDSAIFRQFRLHSSSAGAVDRRLVSMIGGKRGVRVDREFAVETVLKERYAMFLKVYSHATKTAASALLGKALYGVVPKPGRRPARADTLREEDIELLGDQVVVDRLSRHPNDAVRDAGRRLKARRLPRGVYRGVMLGDSERNEEAYGSRRYWLRSKSMETPAERQEVEAELAGAAGVVPGSVMVYCPPRAPGFQQVEHWVTRTRDSAATQGGSYSSEIARRHLGLWEFWVFVADGDESKQLRIGEMAQERLGMPNMINVDRLQGRLS
jgi:HD superfamily phosphohydrolase